MEPSRMEALLEENNLLAKQNADELKKIRKEMLYMGVLRIVVWLVLAGVPVFLYLHVMKPSLEDVFGPYHSVFEGQ